MLLWLLRSLEDKMKEGFILFADSVILTNITTHITATETPVTLVKFKMVFTAIKWHKMANPYHPSTMSV